MISDLRSAVLARLDDWVENALDPQACAAALRAVLELHEPVQMRAGVLPERFGEGRCTFCRHSEPLEVYRDHLNGSARTVEMHWHGPVLDPWCETCGSFDSHGNPEWPCEHVRRIADALGVMS